MGSAPSKRRASLSQSLIHQVIYSVTESRELMKKGAPKSQSLIHQVIYSVRGRDMKLRDLIEVSIPYSSGHLFRSWIFDAEGATWQWVSIPYSSGHLFRWGNPASDGLGFLDPVSIPYSSGHLFRSLTGSGLSRKPAVSIPYSSGHLFR